MKSTILWYRDMAQRTAILKSYLSIFKIQNSKAMNIFDALPHYAQSWEVTDSREFTEEEIAAVKKAEVVNSTYGLSVCFSMVTGGKTYIPLSEDSSLVAGDKIELSSSRLLTLEKEGEAPINIIEI